jgi:hypothetical protein
MKLGSLTWPFVAAAAAILILTLLLVARPFTYDQAVLADLILGGLVCVVLYAIMRALALRFG